MTSQTLELIHDFFSVVTVVLLLLIERETDRQRRTEEGTHVHMEKSEDSFR